MIQQCHFWVYAKTTQVFLSGSIDKQKEVQTHNGHSALKREGTLIPAEFWLYRLKYPDTCSAMSEP